MRSRLLWGAALWLLRPIYLVVELVVAALTTGDYSLIADTVSQLGAAECSPAFCSPAAGLMNGAFVGVGLLLASGALLLAPRTGGGVMVMLLLAGLGSVATGLTPVDEHASLHALAAAPIFVCQPLALLLLARKLRPAYVRLASALLITGVFTGAATVGFFLTGDSTVIGLVERLALWPVIVALAAVATVVMPSSDRSGPDGIPSSPPQ